MIYKTLDFFTTELLRLPETGMGYQIIDARRINNISEERFIVYNSELIVDFNTEFLNYRRQIILEGHTRVLSRVDTLNLVSPTLITKQQVIETRTLSESKKTSTGRHSRGKGAVDSSKVKANGTDSHVRLSAYEDDKRVDLVNKRFIPGTYATTIADYATCKVYKDDPVDRYALPNDEEIKWTFYVQPKNVDYLQQGIVQPAFGHDGGGIEIYFEDGTSNDTYYAKKAY